MCLTHILWDWVSAGASVRHTPRTSLWTDFYIFIELMQLLFNWILHQNADSRDRLQTACLCWVIKGLCGGRSLINSNVDFRLCQGVIYDPSSKSIFHCHLREEYGSRWPGCKFSTCFRITCYPPPPHPSLGVIFWCLAVTCLLEQANRWMCTCCDQNPRRHSFGREELTIKRLDGQGCLQLNSVSNALDFMHRENERSRRQEKTGRH